ncbi:hypothetical protein BIW11_10910 [Tropilaelaps mercedesae]|uniref:AD domain-containing protein n=1 Tax=Tropilaelaps mercedesae TaxID=418985 RepID=A0A1V9XDY5_9ACAR|nr:hypothetical protein BIW11_10910 [Tropilaelaps mercedesae]
MSTLPPPALSPLPLQVATDASSLSQENWQTIRSDPVKLETLLYREVIIRCDKNRCHSGVVQAIDPITQSIIIAEVNSQGKIIELVLCFGSSIDDVFVGDGLSKHAAVVEELFKQQDRVELTQEELNALRDHVLSYLKSHHLPAELCSEDGVTIRIAQIAHIAAPYSVKQVYCQNEIVMERITKLIKEMPPFKPPQTPAPVPDNACTNVVVT